MEATQVRLASKPQALRERTKLFAIRMVKMFRSLPRTEEARVLGKQVLGSGTSVAANYRAVRRARARADIISKLAIVNKEADGTVFWLEFLVETGIFPEEKLRSLHTKADELGEILGSFLNTARTRGRMCEG